MLHRLILLASLLLLVSCSGPHPGGEKSLEARTDQAVLTLYLSASGAAEMAVAARLEEVAVNVGGAWFELGLDPVEINFLQLKEQQMFVGVAVAPLGEPRQIRLKLSGLPGAAADGAAEQLVTLSLREPLKLTGGSSRCLFVDWQLVSEQPGDKTLVSRFTAWGQRQVLGDELLYVACNGINTIYQVRMDINEVVSAFAVPGPLADIQLQSRERRLYILSRGRRAIYVYDCLNSRLIDQIALTGSIAPQEMVLAPDGRYVFVVDSEAGAVFKVELMTGQIVAQQQVGHRPQRISYLDTGLGQLAVTASSANQVLILGAGDLKVEKMLPVGSRPAGSLYFADALYVAESGSQSVAVFDLLSGTQTAKISVGLEPDSLLSIDQNNAYVSNSGEGSLTALAAGQNMALRRLVIAKNPTEMIYSERKRLLYVQHPRDAAVTVVDRDSEQLQQQIRFGGTPQALAILE